MLESILKPLFTLKSLIGKNLFVWVVLLFSINNLYSQTTPEDIIHLSSINDGLKAPVRMAVDLSDNVYVTDANNKLILKFDGSGTLLEEINTGVAPLSLAINRNNEIFFGDGETGIIYQIDINGEITIFYTGLIFPNSMVFDADGLLYVVDSELKKVIVLDLSANVVRNIGEGTLLYPTGIAFNPNNNRIFVAEHGALETGWSPKVKVWMFDLDGTLIGSFGEFQRIFGISSGKCGNIYVIDTYQGEISIFNENGVFITEFGEWGDTAGQLNVPLDIVFNSKDQILVSSMNNGFIEVYDIQNTLPSSKILSFNNTICQGESSDIEIEFTGTAPWTFTYTIDGLNPVEVTNIAESPFILTVSEPGTYEVTALNDANSAGTCFTGKTKIEVNSDPPTSNISSGDLAICSGESSDIVIDFTGLPPWTFTYTKDGLNPETITTTNNPYLLNVSEDGVYEVVALEGGGCSGSSFSGSSQITIHSLPTAHIAEGDSFLPICFGESTDLTIELTGESPWSFTYTVDDSNPVTINDVIESPYKIPVSVEGVYEVKVVSDQNCSNTKTTDFPNVVYLPAAEITNSESTICEGETTPVEISFTGTGPWSFTYAVDGSVSETISNTYSNPYILNTSSPGLYEITEVSDYYYSGTCSAGSATVNINLLPIAGFSYNTNDLEVSFLDASDNASTYLWDFGDGSNSIESSPVHMYQAAGNYTVSLTVTNNNCGENSVSDVIALSETPVEEIDPDEVVKIYPNPSNGPVTIEINNPVQSEIRIEIISTKGVVIYSNIFHAQSVIEQIDLTSFKKGMYIVKIFSEDFFDIRKLILNNSKKRFYSGE